MELSEDAKEYISKNGFVRVYDIDKLRQHPTCYSITVEGGLARTYDIKYYPDDKTFKWSFDYDIPKGLIDLLHIEISRYREITRYKYNVANNVFLDINKE